MEHILLPLLGLLRALPIQHVAGLHDGLFYLYADGLVRAYKDIHVSGRTFGGGRIEMLRREGRILDYDGNSMFALDRAYGFGQARIA